MTTLEILTLVIALWGAGLATYLGYRELHRDKRRIQIFLDYITFVEKLQLVITNTGLRPITINSISVTIRHRIGKAKQDELVRPGAIYDTSNPNPFPFKLHDGEAVTVLLADHISGALFEKDQQIRISVFDIEGNEYTNFRKRTLSGKWGVYEK